MKNSVEISNQILFEQYSVEIECFKKYHKDYGINTHMLFHRITNNKLRSLRSFLYNNHFTLDWPDVNKYFQTYKCVIVGLYIDKIITNENIHLINIEKAKNKEVNYVLEITNTKTNNKTVLCCPVNIIGKGNKINWKKGV